MSRILGILLLLVGIYFLGKDIVFASHYYLGFWRDIPATGSVLAIMSGIITLLFFREVTGNFGWVLLMLGIVLVFLSGGVILKPTSLWNFFLAFVAMIGGYQLIVQGRFRF